MSCGPVYMLAMRARTWTGRLVFGLWEPRHRSSARRGNPRKGKRHLRMDPRFWPGNLFDHDRRPSRLGRCGGPNLERSSVRPRCLGASETGL